MRLTPEEREERLERFGDIKSASRLWDRRCGALEPGAARGCTRPRAHRGLHAPHSGFGRLLSVWQTDPEELSLVILFLGLVALGLSVALRVVSAW